MDWPGQLVDFVVHVYQALQHHMHVECPGLWASTFDMLAVVYQSVLAIYFPDSVGLFPSSPLMSKMVQEDVHGIGVQCESKSLCKIAKFRSKVTLENFICGPKVVALLSIGDLA